MEIKYQLNLKTLPKELLLILKILKEKHPIHSSLLTDIDWNHFIDLTKHHRVYPTIYKRLSGNEDKNIPSFVIDQLQELYQQNAFQMLGLSAVMEQVNELFTTNQIRVLSTLR